MPGGGIRNRDDRSDPAEESRGDADDDDQREQPPPVPTSEVPAPPERGDRPAVLDGDRVYERVADLAAAWNERGNVGLVVGATVPDELEVPVNFVADDDISTDEILRAGTEVLPYRSNIPEISKFSFDVVDPDYYDKAMEVRDEGGHAVIGGKNYGQGSSREHAAIAPRWLGLRLVVARDYARIHWQNLVNFAVLPLTFDDPSDYGRIEEGDVLRVAGIHDTLRNGDGTVEVENTTKGESYTARHQLSDRQVDVLLSGGQIEWMKERLRNGGS